MAHQCPKCESINIYVDDGMLACRHCGQRWIPNFKTYKKLEEDEMGEKRVCENCGRIKQILGRGLCGGCYYAAKKYPEGSLEYIDALAKAKERFNDPNYKAYARTDSKKKSASNVAKQEKRQIHPKPQPKQTSDITALDMLIAERDLYQEKISKLNQAIEILR